MSYVRIKDGVEIEWNPKEKNLGKEATTEVTGKSDFPVKVTDSEASDIRSRYKELEDSEPEKSKE